MDERDPEYLAEDTVEELEEIEAEIARRPDAPEADVIEQHQPLLPETRPDVRVPPEASEADALEQAMPVEGDDEFLEE